MIRTVAEPMREKAGFLVLNPATSSTRALMKSSVISAGLPPPASSSGRVRRGRARGPRRGLRGAGGLSPAHQRSGPPDRRGLHAVHPQCRPRRLSGLGGGGEHAGPPTRSSPAASRICRRWGTGASPAPPKARRSSMPRPRRCWAAASPISRPATSVPALAARGPPRRGGRRRRNGHRRKAEWQPARAREQHAVGGTLPRPCRPARHRRLPGIRYPLPPYWRGAVPGQSLAGTNTLTTFDRRRPLPEAAELNPLLARPPPGGARPSPGAGMSERIEQAQRGCFGVPSLTAQPGRSAHPGSGAALLSQLRGWASGASRAALKSSGP